MPTDLPDFLPFLLKSTISVSLAFIFVWTGLRILRITSYRIHRLGWFTVLLSSWLVFGGFSVDIPLKQSIVADSSPIEISASFQTRNDYLITNEKTNFYLPNTGSVNTNSTNTNIINRNLSVTNRNLHSRPLELSFILLAAWFVGMIIVLFRLVLQYQRFCRLIVGIPSAPDNWTEQWSDVLAETKIRQKIPMYVSELAGPVLIRRMFDNMLIVPRQYWEQLSPESRLTVLRHEKAHFERRDGLKSLLIRILALPQWFNPLAWLAVRRFDEAAEWACDEVACRTSKSGETVADFASALVALHELRHESTNRPVMLPGFAARKPSTRIHRLVQLHEHQLAKDSIMKKTVVLVVLALILAAGLFQVKLVAEQKESEKKTVENAVPVAVPNDPFQAAPPTKPETKKDKSKTPFGDGGGTLNFTSLGTTVPMVRVEAVKKVVDSTGKTHEIVETHLVPSDVAERSRAAELMAQSSSQTNPDVDKFRIEITYTLQNITPDALSEYLKEQFESASYEQIAQTDASAAKTLNTITIKATLADHRKLKQLLNEIEREVEAIQNDAAGVELKTVLIPIKNMQVQSLVQVVSPIVRSGNRTTVSGSLEANTLIVRGTEKEIKEIQELAKQLDEQAEKHRQTIKVSPMVAVPTLPQPIIKSAPYKPLNPDK